MAPPTSPALYLLDYGGGNVRSVINAIKAAGYNDLKLIEKEEDFDKADKIIFPGVGAFGFCISRLNELGFMEPLKKFVQSGKPFFGVCIGMQCLFEGSEEAPGLKGLGIVPGLVRRFQVEDKGLAVPEMGWNGVNVRKHSTILEPGTTQRYYFVHSFIAPPTAENSDWILTTTDYGEQFISSIQKGNVLATQFHPEKSGAAGVDVYRRFIFADSMTPSADACAKMTIDPNPSPTALAPRVIACLDVRSNDDGDLVVTKGDQYDVREKTNERGVRNLGKPVTLAEQYYNDGADEVTFLNITSFRNSPLKDQPMLDVLRNASERVFVPLTIGGGIRDFTDTDGVHRSALEVASAYFRSGADKVSIGSDAVLIAEEYIKTGVKSGTSSIETISEAYGAQAVVISVDPKRVYVSSPDDTKHHTYETATPGPNGERYCWYQCTIKGGRETRDLGAYELVQACEALGAGEILLNSIDKDGTNSGFDLEFVADIKTAVSIPVIASSGAGSAQHFVDVFSKTNVDAALAAGIFHRREVPVQEVKRVLAEAGISVR
eukprot:m.170995 g.170995  ORF g.170995 m.170995 type:complete len:547 (-) comp13317_c0_seq1:855-2495(-)